MCSGTEAGSYLRRIDSCITQLKAQGPSRTCNESKEEGPAGEGDDVGPFARRGLGVRVCGFLRVYVTLQGGCLPLTKYLVCTPSVHRQCRVAGDLRARQTILAPSEASLRATASPIPLLDPAGPPIFDDEAALRCCEQSLHAEGLRASL